MVPENAAVRRFQPDVVFNSPKLRQTCVFCYEVLGKITSICTMVMNYNNTKEISNQTRLK